MFALHRGSFFGLGGVVVFMLASLLMPLFAITGWMLYLDRRRPARRARGRGRVAALSTARWRTGAGRLRQPDRHRRTHRLADRRRPARGRPAGVKCERSARLQPAHSPKPSARCSSPAPSATARRPIRRAASRGGCAKQRRTCPACATRCWRSATAAMTSSASSGSELDQWLHHHGAQPLFDRIEVDAGDDGALRHWQHQLGVFSGRTDLPDWRAPEYATWRLVEREHANPGSPGGPCLPDRAATCRWCPSRPGRRATSPRSGRATHRRPVAAFLAASGHDGDARSRPSRRRYTPGRLAGAFSLLPDPNERARPVGNSPGREPAAATAPRILDRLAAPDGSLQLLVRQMKQPDGDLGLGSGWLTAHADVGGDIALRIRSNPGFHPPADARGLVLIGNGTGLAGLRALLKARDAAGAASQLAAVRRTDPRARPSLRDEPGGMAGAGVHWRTWTSRSRATSLTRCYVQDLLRANLPRLRAWMEEGASIYVCGSPARDGARASKRCCGRRSAPNASNRWAADGPLSARRLLIAGCSGARGLRSQPRRYAIAGTARDLRLGRGNAVPALL